MLSEIFRDGVEIRTEKVWIRFCSSAFLSKCANQGTGAGGYLPSHPESFQRRGGEKSVSVRKVESTFSTSLPLASDLSRTACHSGSSRKTCQLAVAASRRGGARV